MKLLLASLLTAASPSAAVTEAERALRMGRAEQAREMIRTAVAAGAEGRAVDRLLADLSFAEGRWEEALVRYKLLLDAGPRGPDLLERAGVAALRLDRVAEAILFLDETVQSASASATAWNARGVAADRLGEWTTADRAYGAGLRLDPRNPLLLNNLGWSLLLRGEWQEARRHLAAAAAGRPEDRRIRANLDLAEAALLERLPARRQGESNADYAARLNDAGVVALRQGKRIKAAAAFAQAIEAHDRWFSRAANNLALAERRAD